MADQPILSVPAYARCPHDANTPPGVSKFMLGFECREQAPEAACGPPHGGVPALELPGDVPGRDCTRRS